MNTPTASQAHYIKAVFELSSASCDGSARVVDIANKTGVSKASASLAMSKLEKERLVRKDERRQVYLTPAGKRLAVQMLDKCTVIRDFLTDVLTMDKEIAAADACAIEHVVSVDTLCSLCRYVSNGRFSFSPVTPHLYQQSSLRRGRTERDARASRALKR